MILIYRGILLNKGLSSREIEITEKVSVGLRNKEIGNMFDISEKTVKFHLTSIYKKLGVNRSQLVLKITELKKQIAADEANKTYEAAVEQATIAHSNSINQIMKAHANELFALKVSTVNKAELAKKWPLIAARLNMLSWSDASKSIYKAVEAELFENSNDAGYHAK